MLTVNELFAGIGAFRNALIRLNIPHEIVGISEIDKFAITSYEAMYGKTRNYGDISKYRNSIMQICGLMVFLVKIYR